MAVTVSPQVIVCPHCDKQFNYNRVNGMALLEIASNIERQKQMHCRLTLNALERELGKTPQWALIKKAVLDGYNDLARDVHAVLGFGEAEVE